MTDAETSESRVFPLPIHNRGFQIIFYTLLLIFVAGLLATGWTFQTEEKLFPYVVGVPTLLVLIAHVLLLMFPSLKERVVPERERGFEEVDEMLEEVAEEIPGRPLAERQRYEFIMIGWLIGLGLLILLFGYAALPFFLLGFWSFLIENSRKAIILTIVYTVIAYLLFIHFLGMSPWLGIFGIPIPGV